MRKLLYIIALTLPTLFFAQESEKENKCDLPANYQEPKPDKKIQGWLKRGDATIEDLRKHIAIDNDIEISDVVFLRISEQKGNGIYSACAKGKEIKYKRMGTVFMRNSENPFDVAK
ncbi:hypothetical protein [Kaistella jeonii]|uniref:hypothetical protein n=1 Tax=Kaistella jeonii TaxID=266749 RepID=UPI00068EC78D|nr:hypothetical protein [Kaistella jeonii]SFB74402.1 hypothetical protein SAMN05421876_101539 [Kaistella jeonii]VEI95125.1 Uncharacterised protein [Kaistella jeonii]